jgi:hypothetical protein
MLRRLPLMLFNSRASATITSCPNWPSTSLIQWQCVPVSKAIRPAGILPNSFSSACCVLDTCPRFDDLSRAVQDAEMALLISHVDPDGDPHLPLTGARAPLFVDFLAMLFTAGSFLHFECVPLGA